MGNSRLGRLVRPGWGVGRCIGLRGLAWLGTAEASGMELAGKRFSYRIESQEAVEAVERGDRIWELE